MTEPTAPVPFPPCAEVVLHYWRKHQRLQASQDLTADESFHLAWDPNLDPSLLVREIRANFPLFRYLFDDNVSLTDIVSTLRKRPPRSDIQNINPFLRQFSAEILARIPLQEIALVVDSNCRDENVTHLADFLEFNSGRYLVNAATWSRAYDQALQEEWDEHAAKQRLISHLADCASLTNTQLDDPLGPQPLTMQWFDAAAIVPRRQFLGIILAKGQVDPDQQIACISSLATKFSSYILVVVVLGDVELLGYQLRAQIPKDQLVLLDENDLKNAALSKDPSETLRLQIAKQLPLALISPYSTAGPVTGDIFFGRDRELRRILEAPDSNFSVLGSRRIGKTSLLKTLLKLVNEKNAIPGARAVFIDATMHTRIDRFQKNLLAEINRATGQSLWIEPGREFFEELAEQLRNTELHFLLLVDECDRLLLDREPAASLEHFARSMSNEEYVRLVFAGYKILSERIRDRSSSFYNLFEPMELGPLVKRDAEELLRQPMARIGVQFDRDDVVDRILELGSTVPWLLQEMCVELLNLLHARNSRIITLPDVETVYKSATFTKHMTAYVRDDTDMPLLERLIAYLLVREDAYGLDEKQIFEAVNRVTYGTSLTDIRKALSYLTSTYVIEDNAGIYRFWLPSLRLKLRETETDLPFVINQLAIEYRKCAQ